MLFLGAAPARALDGVSIEGGSGEGIRTGRAALQWDWHGRWLQTSEWHAGGHWDIGLAYWHRHDAGPGERDELFDFAFTPVLRLQPNGFSGPCIEAGIGLHLLSHTSIGNKQMSTAFQFGNHVGVGYRFGAKGSFDIAYRFQHMSNGGIKKPNPGIDFHQVRAQYHF